MNIVRGGDGDLRVFYERHNGRLGISFDALKNALSDWEIWRIDDMAVVLKKDGEGHVSAYKNSRVGIKAMREIMDRLGITRTAVTSKFKAGHALAKRLGFRPELVKNGVTYYVRSA